MGNYLGKELIQKAVDYINSGRCVPSIATVDSNGKIGISHMGLTRAKNAKTIRFGFYNKSQALKNVLENGKICMSVIGDNNIVFTVNGTGKKIREILDFVVVEMKVDEVQSKRSPYLTVIRGIEFEDHSPESVLDMYKEILK
ncbi:MAG TPA: pyridoxamine 5'-phosphate oxidase family protein [archaeon]|nr:pyridoxamine 5'-phosphate oxidase family protein [archaeon]